MIKICGLLLILNTTCLLAEELDIANIKANTNQALQQHQIEVEHFVNEVKSSGVAYEAMINELKEATVKLNQPLQANSTDSDKAAGNVCLTPIIFVSLSLPESILIQLAKDASLFHAQLVLQGFKDNSAKQTAIALHQLIQKTGVGFSIDPKLFQTAQVTQVPTIALMEKKKIDKLSGNVSLQYALEQFAARGDLRFHAQKILQGAGL